MSISKDPNSVNFKWQFRGVLCSFVYAQLYLIMLKISLGQPGVTHIGSWALWATCIILLPNNPWERQTLNDSCPFLLCFYDHTTIHVTDKREPWGWSWLNTLGGSRQTGVYFHICWKCKEYQHEQGILKSQPVLTITETFSAPQSSIYVNKQNPMSH